MEWIQRAQKSLVEENLAGWLIYDFRGSNPIAKQFLDLAGMFSRRIFCYIPAEGEATLLVHAIETSALKDYPLSVLTYSSRQSLEQILTKLLPQKKIALEYSPNNDIPYISHVDAGTVDLLRSLGITVASSANILQTFSVWTKEQHNAHLKAAEHVVIAKNIAFDYLSLHAPMGKSIRETEIQKVITDYFDTHKLEYDHPPIVGFAAHSGDPHYIPQVGKDAVLKKGDMVLIDLWAKLPKENAPYADITWMGVYGEPNEEQKRVWRVVKEGRDVAVEAIRAAYADHRCPEGREIDRACRDFIDQEGYADAFTHRTGHSLGTRYTHGDAAHLDDFETCDTRELRPGFGITVEPGVYLEDFGVRSEINIYLTDSGPEITTDIQNELIII